VPHPVIARSAATSQSSHPSFLGKRIDPASHYVSLAPNPVYCSHPVYCSQLRHCEESSDVAIHLLLWILQVHLLLLIKNSAKNRWLKLLLLFKDGLRRRNLPALRFGRYPLLAMTEVGQLSLRSTILLKFRLLQVHLLLPPRLLFPTPSLRGE